MNARLKRHALAALLIAALGGSAGVTLAQTTAGDINAAAATFDRTANHAPTRAAANMSQDFSTLVGSEADALNLIEGLRSGTTVMLPPETPATEPVTITPSGPMGYGNVFITLALAQASLTQAGIADPTSAELAIALTGGTILINDQETIFQGILTMRAAGMGWGQIAKENGFKLGHVISAIKSGNARLAKSIKSGETRSERSAAKALDKSDHRARADASAQGERAAKLERPSRPEKVERAERPERPERPDKPERPEKVERPGKG